MDTTEYNGRSVTCKTYQEVASLPCTVQNLSCQRMMAGRFR